MKLIPISNASSWKPAPLYKEDKRYKFRRKTMIEKMKPLQPLLRDLSENPEDNTLYELVWKKIYGGPLIAMSRMFSIAGFW